MSRQSRLASSFEDDEPDAPAKYRRTSLLSGSSRSRAASTFEPVAGRNARVVSRFGFAAFSVSEKEANADLSTQPAGCLSKNGTGAVAQLSDPMTCKSMPLCVAGVKKTTESTNGEDDHWEQEAGSGTPLCETMAAPKASEMGHAGHSETVMQEPIEEGEVIASDASPRNFLDWSTEDEESSTGDEAELKSSSPKVLD